MASFEILKPKKLYLKLSKIKIALINFKVLSYNDKLFKEINNMKYYTKLFLTSVATLTLLTACGSKTENKTSSKTDTAETSQSLQKSTAETVEFFATGDYEAGVDIEPGSYYIVLTDIQYAEKYKDYSAYVGVAVKSSSDKEKFYEGSIEEIGKPYRVTLEKGDKITFSDGYDPTSWTMTFFTADDYKEYQKSEKK